MAAAKPKRLPSDESYVLVASIDFGTTFSGYSFSFQTSQNDIRMNKTWGDETGLPSFKAPTSVLLDNRGKLLAFGFKAETLYNELVMENGEKSCELYRHFKMTLHNQENLTRESQVQSVRGKWENAMKIFAHALEYIKDHLLDAVAKSTASDPDVKLIRWVLTVPAIWSEESKQFMREVAFQAGLIDEINSQRMLICLEPEAASIYCRQLEIDQFSAGNEGATKLLHKVNTKYMIIDAGGGTVDITVHEILGDGTVKEIRAASGGAWGGTKVDENFVNVLKKAFGTDYLSHFQSECPSGWLELIVNFERRKRGVNIKGYGSAINIPIGWEFGGKFKERTGKEVKAVLNDNVVQGISFRNGNICLNNDLVRSLFESVSTEIVKHIRQELQACPEIELILMVGGFGESDYLRAALEMAFCPRIPVLVPLEASIAIVKGATIFGHRSDIISSRIARKTYGFCTMDKFDPTKHSEDKKKYYPNEGVYWVRGVDVFVRKNEPIPTNQIHSRVQHPMRKNQTKIILIFVSSDTADITYEDDPTVKKIGSLGIDIPDTTLGVNRRVQVKLYFGQTQIHAEAYELKPDGNGEKFTTTMDLLTK